MWPVLTVFVLLLGSAVVLEVYARRRDPQAIVIVIRGDAAGSLSSDENGNDAHGEVEEDPSAPLDPAHAQARELTRRGELSNAVAQLEQLAAARPTEAVLLVDLGYAQLLSDAPEHAVATLERATQLGTQSPYAYLNLGVGLRRVGRLPEATAAIEHALVLKPAFRSARLASATVLRYSKRFDEAAAILEDLAKSGGNASRAESLLALGRTRLAQAKPKAAQAAFDRAIEWAPSSAELRISIARAYLATDQASLVAKGRAAAEIAAQLAPDLAIAHSTLARAKELAGDVEGASEGYQTALRLAPEYHHARRRLLRLALERRDYSTARALAARLLSAAPELPEHHFLAGLVAARGSDVEGARTHYHAAIDAASGHYPEACFNLGLAEKEAGRLPEAIAAYQRAIASKADYVAAYNNLGLAYVASNKPSDAETAYQEALALDPRYSPALVNLGKLFLSQKRFDDATRAFEQAVAVRPDAREALLNLGVAYRKAGQLERAIATYRTLVAAQPRYVAAHYNLGIALERASDQKGAKHTYQQALTLDTEHGPSRRRLAALLVNDGNLILAKQHYQTLVDSDPTDRRAWLGLAELHRKGGDLAACMRAVTAAAADSDPNEIDQAIRKRCGQHDGTTSAAAL